MERKVLDNVSFFLNEGDRVGIVGINGTGKSTLLRILAGAEEADTGEIIRTNGIRLSYLPQIPVFGETGSVLEQVLGALPEDLKDAKEYEAKSILEQMHLPDYDRPISSLSGGERDHFVAQRPILWVLTVNTAPGGKICSHGLFIGEGRNCLTEAVKLAQQKNIDYVEHGIKKCVVFLDPSEFTSTWLGNKSIYRTRMAMADGGELIVLAPGVHTFGEDKAVDALIRKYGYKGRLHTLEVFNRPDAEDLRANMGAAAHLIHGSSDGRFSITYCVKNITKAEIEGVGFKAADYDEMIKKYDPTKLQYGYNTVDGEEIYFIPNPALGLWINRERFNA